MDIQEKKVAAFLERLRERLSDSVGASRSGMHRAAFTALQPFIDGSLTQGYTMRATWIALREEKKLSMSYETFRTHSRRVGIGVRSGAMSPPEEAPRTPRRGDLD